jgi:hypothetical protein
VKTPADIQPVFEIESAILTVRGEKVLLDSDLARIYGVPIMRLLDPPPEPEPPHRQIGFHVRPGDETTGATKGKKR